MRRLIYFMLFFAFWYICLNACRNGMKTDVYSTSADSDTIVTNPYTENKWDIKESEGDVYANIPPHKRCDYVDKRIGAFTFGDNDLSKFEIKSFKGGLRTSTNKDTEIPYTTAKIAYYDGKNQLVGNDKITLLDNGITYSSVSDYFAFDDKVEQRNQSVSYNTLRYLLDERYKNGYIRITAPLKKNGDFVLNIPCIGKLD